MMSRVAVVLSGGGAKGAYEAGALKSIVRHTERVDIITGASIGAINAAVFATRLEDTGNLSEAAAALERLWTEVRLVLKLNLWAIIGRVVSAALRKRSTKLADILSFPSVVDDREILKTIDNLIPTKRIREIRSIDLAINATDLNTGRTITFWRENDANLRDAVLASMSIPIVFPSRKLNRSYYVDGGVFNNTPLRDALMLGATKVCVVGLRPKEKAQYQQDIVDLKPFHGIYEVATRLAELILDKIMYEDLKKAKKLNQIISLIHEMEQRGGDHEAIRKLKQAIEYEKHGRVKKVIEFVEINPTKRLEPPGTLGFDQLDAIRKIMELGEQDAERALRNASLGESAPSAMS